MDKDFKIILRIINSCRTIEQLEGCNRLLEGFEFKYGHNKELRELAIQFLNKEKQLSPDLLSNKKGLAL